MTYRIVAGVDETPEGRAALRWAIGEARARDGEVIALYAWETPLLAFPGAFDPAWLEQAAKDLLMKIVMLEAPKPGIPLRPVVAEGEPAQTLLRASAEADLVVLGNSGHPHRPGSPRHACAARCACPVVLVRPADEGTAGPRDRTA
jgi:nucleotide-binding universal stress UspA family protein